MEKYELNKNNNSKKLIIGVSILFCAVILIIGTSLAFFTQSDSKELGNIVSSNDNNAYINYIEEKSMMFDNLIPMKSYNLYDAIGSGCVDSNGYNVCSVYMFTLENTYGELQKINISMIPTANSFTNLKYMVAKIGADGMPTFISDEPLPLEKNNLNSINLLEGYPLYSGDENVSTFAILFYIESMDYDQTEEDAGKSFGASIRVDSITTGNYFVKSFGDSCWDIEYAIGKESGYKLTGFHGINDDGTLKKECENIYVTQDEVDKRYKVTVPSTYGGYNITTFGGFQPYIYDENGEAVGLSPTTNIKEITFENGIKKFDDGALFGFMGFDGSDYIEGFELKVNLPNTLEYIGNLNFFFCAIKEITIPKSVKRIGNGQTVFTGFNKVIIEGAEDDTSNLKYIGDNAFHSMDIKEIIIPSSVISIGESAFRSTELTKVIFKTREDGTSDLRTIGETAFFESDLDYQDENNPLVIPRTVEYIGNYAFVNNTNLKFIKYTGTNLSNFVGAWNATIITK